jgi:RNA polymerase sigma-70 factor, ECF subfamily
VGGGKERRSWLNFADEAPSNAVEDGNVIGGKPAGSTASSPANSADDGISGGTRAGTHDGGAHDGGTDGEADGVQAPRTADADADVDSDGDPTGSSAAGNTSEQRLSAMSGVVALGRTAGLGLSAMHSPAPVDERSDTELIRETREGQQAAFAVLVRRYSERAYRAAYRVVRDPHQAEEIVQEALIKAYRGLDGFELRSSFYTWLYKIVVNLALDRRRREGRAPNVEWDDSVAGRVDPRAVSPTPGDPELASRRRQVREFVAQGVQELPDPQREVLLLREVEGLSYEEIADKMQISKGTVMSRLHYARKKMVLFLTQCGVDPEDVA